MTNDKIPNDEARMTKATGLSPPARHAHFIPHSDFGLHSSLGISSLVIPNKALWITASLSI